MRQIYYQLVVKQIIPNRQESYRKLSRLCVVGRDEDILPEEAFADRLREVDKPPSWLDLQDFMDEVRHSYRKDKWYNQSDYLEIWSEKDALRSVLTQVTYPYDVSLLIVRGQVSRTAIYQAYERYSAQVNEGKECCLYYAGDFDPSGLSIYNSLRDRLTNFGDAGKEIYFERIALTPEQIEAYSLPSDPGKETDLNFKRFVSEYGNNVVELDALPPDALRRFVQDCIEEHIDHDLLEQVQETEHHENVEMGEFLAGMN